MSHRRNARLLLLCCIAVLPTQSFKANCTAVASDIDRAFEQFVDLGLATRAIEQRDISLLCDVALQLAEGERRLLRQHKSGLNSTELLDRCLNLAIEKMDDQTIERISKANQQLGAKELAAKIKAAQQLGGSARSTNKSLNIALDELSVADYATLKEMLSSIDAARTVGDAEALDEMDQALNATTFLNDKQKTEIRQRIQAARTSIEEMGESSEAFKRLASATRYTQGYSDLQPVSPSGPAKRYEMVIVNKTGSPITFRLLYNFSKRRNVRLEPGRGSRFSYVGMYQHFGVEFDRSFASGYQKGAAGLKNASVYFFLPAGNGIRIAPSPRHLGFQYD